MDYYGVVPGAGLPAHRRAASITSISHPPSEAAAAPPAAGTLPRRQRQQRHLIWLEVTSQQIKWPRFAASFGTPLSLCTDIDGWKPSTMLTRCYGNL